RAVSAHQFAEGGLVACLEEASQQRGVRGAFGGSHACQAADVTEQSLGADRHGGGSRGPGGADALPPCYSPPNAASHGFSPDGRLTRCLREAAASEFLPDGKWFKEQHVADGSVAARVGVAHRLPSRCGGHCPPYELRFRVSQRRETRNRPRVEVVSCKGFA